VLQPLRPADAVDHLAGEDSELVRWLNGGPGTLDIVTSYLAEVERRWAAGGPSFSFAIRSAADHTLAGTLDVHFGQEFVPDTHANLAYGLYPAYRGRDGPPEAFCSP
ncbi:MAG: GNAT family N-acetyltransferase, partial [Propionibacteriaceae bacterium]|nr:GNAT family N-acetyltransferase [Propionibacteriaceae bacterium]